MNPPLSREMPGFIRIITMSSAGSKLKPGIVVRRFPFIGNLRSRRFHFEGLHIPACNRIRNELGTVSISVNVTPECGLAFHGFKRPSGHGFLTDREHESIAPSFQRFKPFCFPAEGDT